MFASLIAGRKLGYCLNLQLAIILDPIVLDSRSKTRAGQTRMFSLLHFGDDIGEDIPALINIDANDASRLYLRRNFIMTEEKTLPRQIAFSLF